MPASVRISETDWRTFERQTCDEGAVILLPIGSLEQHGPHSPLGSDEMLTRLMAEEIARQTGAVVAPSIAYGVRSQPRTGGGDHFVGTTSLRGDTLVALTRDIIAGFLRKGAKAILVLDTHYENEFFVIEGIEEAIRELKAEGIEDFKVVKVRYFELLDEKVIAALFPDGFVGWALEHAAVMTTSLHLHLTPELVDMSLAPTHGPIEYPPYDIFPQDPARGTQTGCLSSPAPATAEKGKLVHDTVVRSVSELIAREFGKK